MLDIMFDQLALFEGLDTSQRTLLKPYFVGCAYEDEDVIFAQGGRAKFLYVLVEGEVAIYFKPDDGPELVVSRIKAGGVFGWSAAFGSGFYTSGATCTQTAKLLRVCGTDLKMLCEKYPETGILILERLASVVARRIENNNDYSDVVAFLEHGLKNGIKPIGG